MLSDRIAMFNAQVAKHNELQALNPFSSKFDKSRSPSPRPGEDDYGRPVAGSKTEKRGQKAKSQVLREILDLCIAIHDLALYNHDLKIEEGEPVADDDTDIVTFGELFDVYAHVNNKLVGLLISAKKRGFIYFEKEMLFQRRDDDVLVALIKPIKEIKMIVTRELEPSPGPSLSPRCTPSPVPSENYNENNKLGENNIEELNTDTIMHKNLLQDDQSKNEDLNIDDKIETLIIESSNDMVNSKLADEERINEIKNNAFASEKIIITEPSLDDSNQDDQEIIDILKADQSNATEVQILS